MPRATDTRSAAAALAVAALVLAAASAGAHGGEEHSAPAPETGPAAFDTPAPGSYALPPLGAAADGWVLTDRGERTRLHALFGEGPTLLSFIYTKCSDAQGCPMATATLHSVGAKLGKEPEVARTVRLVSLSFDPAHDTPDVMQRYGQSFEHAALDWRFATTESEAALAPLLSAYRQTRVAERDAAGEETGQYAHLLRVFLIDTQRRIRQVYSTSLLSPDALVADVKTLLLAEAGAGDPAFAASFAAADDTRGPGDVRAGYEGSGFTTASRPLAARRGRPADLAARVARPPLGLPPVPVPDDNPITAEKVALGRRLFFDRRLSLNDTVSCAMCHVPEQGFTSNEMATAVGIEGRTVRRNAPTLFNVAYAERLFHDGRETTLENQVWGPLLARNEMGNPSLGAVIEKLRGLDDYAERFDAAFPGRGISVETIGMALATYQRTLVSGASPLDRKLYGREKGALSPAAARGLALFTGKARCAGCHPIGAESALLTDQGFHNTGIGYAAAMGGGAAGEASDTQRVQAAPGVYLDVPRSIVAQVSERPQNDLGLYEITLDPADRWRYRTPTLRNVALSAPYMHDGSLATLADVVAFYDRGGAPNEGLDPAIRPIGLSARERSDLVAFLESLTGDDVDSLVSDAFAAPIGDVGRSASTDSAP